MSRFKFSDEPPTDRQLDFAVDISSVLGIDLPTEYTKSAYSDFISSYRNAYYSELEYLGAFDGGPDYD